MAVGVEGSFELQWNEANSAASSGRKPLACLQNACPCPEPPSLPVKPSTHLGDEVELQRARLDQAAGLVKQRGPGLGSELAAKAGDGAEGALPPAMGGPARQMV